MCPNMVKTRTVDRDFKAGYFMSFYPPMTLFSDTGERKYLNAYECEKFYAHIWQLPQDKMLFCLLIYCTGARISEIYNLTKHHLDFTSKLITIRTLKQGKKIVYRQIPMPDSLSISLEDYLRFKQIVDDQYNDYQRLWSFSLRSGARAIKCAMKSAGVSGIRSCARGLRHSFAVHAVTEIPLTKVQKWMGHAKLSTTAIYLDVSGDEERKWAEKMWHTMPGIGGYSAYGNNPGLSGKDYHTIKMKCLNSLKNIDLLNEGLKHDSKSYDTILSGINAIKSTILEIYSILHIHDHGNSQSHMQSA